jgi:hypothetical protein
MSGRPANAIFRPLWVRVLIVIACAVWAVVEALNGQAGWAALAAAATAYGAWSLLIAYRDTPDQDREARDERKE